MLVIPQPWQKDLKHKKKNNYMIKRIEYKEQVLAIIIFASFEKQGIEFFTTDDYSQQLGYMNRPEGYVIPPHRHNLVPREVMQTQEVLFIKSGKLRVDFYDEEQNYIESSLLSKGDVILLAKGGHGFKMLEQCEIIEVKQGPYCGEMDKVRFESVKDENVLIK
jgi:mannose-6-phosphate isomerase-like protein (cupin superfamily)